MSRTARLLDLLQILRRSRYPIRGQALAEELHISLRTLYRDIATLQAQGARIEGEPGLGYMLRPGFLLPPLMFEEEELEAIVLGIRWVAEKTDTKLARSARNALAKIAAVLPKELHAELTESTLFIGSRNDPSYEQNMYLPLIREAIRLQQKLNLTYIDKQQHTSQRVIWPLGIGFLEKVRVVIAWCEQKQDFRHFRLDHIQNIERLVTKFPQRRQVLLKEWERRENISLQT